MSNDSGEDAGCSCLELRCSGQQLETAKLTFNFQLTKACHRLAAPVVHNIRFRDSDGEQASISF